MAIDWLSITINPNVFREEMRILNLPFSGTVLNSVPQFSPPLDAGQETTLEYLANAHGQPATASGVVALKNYLGEESQEWLDLVDYRKSYIDEERNKERSEQRLNGKVINWLLSHCTVKDAADVGAGDKVLVLDMTTVSGLKIIEQQIINNNPY